MKYKNTKKCKNVNKNNWVFKKNYVYAKKYLKNFRKKMKYQTLWIGCKSVNCVVKYSFYSSFSYIPIN